MHILILYNLLLVLRKLCRKFFETVLDYISLKLLKKNVYFEFSKFFSIQSLNKKSLQ